jgi:hypothetical protein
MGSLHGHIQTLKSWEQVLCGQSMLLTFNFMGRDGTRLRRDGMFLRLT